MTGGTTAGSELSTTLVYDYTERWGPWLTKGRLPGDRGGLRSASLNGVLHVSGGQNSDGSTQFYSEVLAWDNVTEKWSLVGSMAGGGRDHAMVEVTLSSLGCSPTV